MSADDLVIEAPEVVDAPLTVWDVAFASAEPSPRGVPDFVTEVGVTFAAPSPGGVVLAVDGPGVFAPLTATRFPAARSGAEVRARWRWAVPLRAEAPPYDLRLTAKATYGGSATTTATRVVRVEPPPPPEEDVFVSDLDFSWATNGYGPPERDAANGELRPGDGGAIRLDGRTYEKGVGTNARSVVGVHLGGRCTRFTAVVGIDDARGSAGSVRFRVVGDGRVLYESAVLGGSSPAEHVSVDVTGVDQLDLVADPTEDGQGDDGADWADARLEHG